MITKWKETFEEINRNLKSDMYTITQMGSKYHLTKVNDDLIYGGSGRFERVYKQKSTGLILKNLKMII